MKKKLVSVLLGLFLLTIPSIVRPDVVFWDITQTLVDIAKFDFFRKKLGFDIIVNGFLFKMRNPMKSFSTYLRNDYFKKLEQIPYKLGVKNSNNGKIPIYADDGTTKLPPLLADLMLGNITYTEAKEACDAWLTSDACSFSSERTKRLFLKTFEMNFNPNKFVRFLKVMPATCNVLSKCATQVANGKKKNINIILSNFASDAVKPFKQKFASPIMQYVDDCIFSGEIGIAKPNPEIYNYCYKYVCKQFPSHKDETFLFVDDQKVNRDATASCTKKFICCHPDNAQKMLKQCGTIH